MSGWLESRCVQKTDSGSVFKLVRPASSAQSSVCAVAPRIDASATTSKAERRRAIAEGVEAQRVERERRQGEIARREEQRAEQERRNAEKEAERRAAEREERKRRQNEKQRRHEEAAAAEAAREAEKAAREAEEAALAEQNRQQIKRECAPPRIKS